MHAIVRIGHEAPVFSAAHLKLRLWRSSSKLGDHIKVIKSSRLSNCYYTGTTYASRSADKPMLQSGVALLTISEVRTTAWPLFPESEPLGWSA